MEELINIKSKYIKGDIPLDKLNLENLPDFPVFDNVDNTRYIGYVHYFNENEGYAFIVTNGQGFDTGAVTRAKEIFFHKSDWQGDSEISTNLLITFSICKRGDNKEKAVNIKPFACTVEDYELGKAYVDQYSHVIGTIRGNYVSKRYSRFFSEC